MQHINQLTASISQNDHKQTAMQPTSTHNSQQSEQLEKENIASLFKGWKKLFRSKMKDEDWENVVDTNLTSVYRMSKRAVRGMMKARRGRIINITSVVAQMGNAGQSNYAATKAGVEGFSRTLAREIGSRQVTINCVAPGLIETDMTDELDERLLNSMLDAVPISRLGQPEDIAAAVSFLASDEASYITGAIIPVNGGMYM